MLHFVSRGLGHGTRKVAPYLILIHKDILKFSMFFFAESYNLLFHISSVRDMYPDYLIVLDFIVLVISLFIYLFVYLFIYLFLSFFLLAQQPPVVQGPLIQEVSRPHTTTQHSR